MTTASQVKIRVECVKIRVRRTSAKTELIFRLGRLEYFLRNFKKFLDVFNTKLLHLFNTIFLHESFGFFNTKFV